MTPTTAILRFFRPATYIRKLREWWYRRHYDISAIRHEEAQKFSILGFDKDQGLRELEEHLAALGLSSFNQCSDAASGTSDMASAHWLLFACLRQRQRPIRRILEIGTFDGQTTALLTRLFPTSEVVTLDLPPEDPIVAETYSYARGGEKTMLAFEKRLRENVASPNVLFIRANSFFLPQIVYGKFDLIWIDGGHLYPEIAWDICNAYHLLHPTGILMCDDVIPQMEGLRDRYVSPDSYQVLRYVIERTKDPMHLFLKRESAFWSADPQKRKFVAVLVKNGHIP